MDGDFRAARIDTGYLERLLAHEAVGAEERVPGGRGGRGCGVVCGFGASWSGGGG